MDGNIAIDAHFNMDCFVISCTLYCILCSLNIILAKICQPALQ